jgi:hypothetical protein
VAARYLGAQPADLEHQALRLVAQRSLGDAAPKLGILGFEGAKLAPQLSHRILIVHGQSVQ